MLVKHEAAELTPEQRFGKSVRAAREARDWSQEVLARRVREVMPGGFDQSTVARIEGGRRMLRLNDAAVLAQVLGIDLSLQGNPRTAPAEPQGSDPEAAARYAELAEARAIHEAIGADYAAALERVIETDRQLKELRRRAQNLGASAKAAEERVNAIEEALAKLGAGREEGNDG